MPSPIFAFITDGYYFNNGKGSTSYKDLPDDLETSINGSNSRSVIEVYGGPNDEYFFKTRHDNDSEGVPSGIDTDSLKFIAWGPESQRWLKRADGSTKTSSLPTALSDYLHSNHPNVARVSFGPGGRWAAVKTRGGWQTGGGVSSSLVRDIRSNGSGVRNIVLCPWDEDYYWVELIDGEISYYLPSSWTTSIQRRL